MPVVKVVGVFWSDEMSANIFFFPYSFKGKTPFFFFFFLIIFNCENSEASASKEL